MNEPRPLAPALPAGLDTPCIVIDLDVIERNAQRMASVMAARGIALRPHIKTHKSVALARIQLDAGAAGITVGTLGEAEVMAQAGINDIFLAYPLWADDAKGARLKALLQSSGLQLAIGVDSIAGAERLAAAAHSVRNERNEALRVLIEVDPGYHRTGVASGSVGQIAAAAERLGLELIGVFSHGGHAYAGRERVDQAAHDEVLTLAAASDSLRAAGVEARILSAGSTPTALGVAAAPVNEVRPGTYLINDRIQVHMGSSAAEDVAMAVAATVVSNAVPGKFVINAGAKTLTKDVPPYLQGYGFLPAYPDAVIERVSDYHGEVRLPDGARAPNLGDVVAVVPNHACPTIDLFDSFTATRNGRIIGEWPVDARGRSR